MASSELYEIFGCVTAVNATYFTLITLPTEEDPSRTFYCVCPFFKPVHEGDIVHGIVSFDGSTTVTFVQDPFVEIPTDGNNIQTMFMRALHGTNFGKVSASRLYNAFIDYVKDDSPSTAIVSLLSDLATTHRDSPFDGTPVDTLMLIASSQTEYVQTSSLSGKQAGTLLTWWYKNYCLRRLYLLGLTNKEIKLARKPLDEIYTLSVGTEKEQGNPYRIPSIPPEKCLTIMKSLGLEPSSTQLECGGLARRVFEMTENQGWTCVPPWILSKVNPRWMCFKDELVAEYGLRFDECNSYLEYPLKVETYVAEYLDRLIKSTAAHLAEIASVPKIDSMPYHCATLTQDQKDAIRGALECNLSIITGGAGTGKCLHPDTPLMLSDGRLTLAKRVRPGDSLMGDDSKPRRVLSITSGTDPMYRIIPEKGRTFICNGPHLLTLQGLVPSIVEYPEPDDKGKTFGVKFSALGFPYEQSFDTREEAEAFKALLIPDIFDLSVNTYLGYTEEYRKNLHLFHVSVDFPDVDVPIDPYEIGRQLGSEWLPAVYLRNSRAKRLRLFEGIVKSLGTRNGNLITLELCSGSPDIEYLAHTLGYLVWEGRTTQYIDTSGNLRLNFAVKSLGDGEYCGFEIDGNGRFLLANCLVTHNTTIIGEIVRNLEGRHQSCLVASFTGKAVARLQEVLEGKSAMTLDRAIVRPDRVSEIKSITAREVSSTATEIVEETEMFRHLIIDEVSMVTTELFYRFITTFKHKYKITLVGDINQLQPIGWGSFLRQLLESNRVPVYRLRFNHRIERNYLTVEERLAAEANPSLSPGEQNFDRIILENAEALIAPSRDYQIPIVFKEGPGFSVLEGGLNVVAQIVAGLAGAGASKDDIVAICPYRDDIYPDHNDLTQLNSIFQTVFLQGAERRQDPLGNVWYVGDRVMMLVNNYKINIMNGEEGVIVQVAEDGILVQFKNNVQYTFKYATSSKYPKKSRKESDEMIDEDAEEQELTTAQLQHSFAITIHKAQGSERQYVIILVPLRKTERGSNIDSNFLNVNLLYTAITRTKKMVWIVGSFPVLYNATCHVQARRNDLLASRLKAKADPQLEMSIAQINSVAPLVVQPNKADDEPEPEHEDLSIYENLPQ